MANKRPYPHKRDADRRIAVTFSLSGDELKAFREALSKSESHEPDVVEIRAKANALAHQSIRSFVQSVLEINEAIMG